MNKLSRIDIRELERTVKTTNKVLFVFGLFAVLFLFSVLFWRNN